MTLPPGRTERLSRVLFSALLGPSQLFLFGPFTVYHNNPGEFSVPFLDLIGPLLLALLVSVSALVGLGFVVSRRWFPAYVAVLFGFGVLLWLQGNLLVGNYGLLEADAIDFDEQAWRGPWEIGLWVGALLLLASFAHRVIASAPLASQLLIVLQALSVVVLNRPIGGPAGRAQCAVGRPSPRGLRIFDKTERDPHSPRRLSIGRFPRDRRGRPREV